MVSGTKIHRVDGEGIFLKAFHFLGESLIFEEVCFKIGRQQKNHYLSDMNAFHTKLKQFYIKQALRKLTPDSLFYLFPGAYPDTAKEMPEEDIHEEEIHEEEIPEDRTFDYPTGEFYSIHKREDVEYYDAFGYPEPEAASEEEFASPTPTATAIEDTSALFYDDFSDDIAMALTAETKAKIREIAKFLFKHNISFDELQAIVDYRVPLSPIRITRGGKIFLTNFDNKEVKMPKVAKALYFLYLRHPEGIPFKALPDYREELLFYYKNISGRSNVPDMEESIDKLLDPFGNGIHVTASRIKGAFLNVVHEHIARFYYLNGNAGEAKKVPLDSDLVIWEY